MNRGEIWWAEVGRKSRPVLVLTRPEVIDVRKMVTVAEITTTIRGLGVEILVAESEAGLTEASVVNCDGLHTVRRSSLSRCVGELDEQTMQSVCRAVSYALGC
ncbi:MAG: type II toxin-antitoxin system PemK/MazF family toxin [Acidimicrobiaceae bacterium]|nr:type II toxin-antitoxin system PemK/MazF family toxin [Acidimicrobiaceae bacterium]MXW75905.1 type II toxin-antitoxin system PemK/MazF family toxin [Acidimicrobiaceae bacterium]MYC42986.1 type II toxin-antitoxin system PemK/MazF family toxin [Acidimicrobiaceae bacterium]MYD07280.1 type II toxin-antitoxin system PemK/MazF family toxin [Acidimicrobiaceae bacterium]MYH88889.1 type II toxin-antitoxin system PemK/MazF family toxin [Acidimicrobiaceae bacterium]